MTLGAQNAPGPLSVGQPAPDFILQDHNEETVTLSDFRGRSSVVLFFYPKDDSPSCRREACSFRDQYAVFREAGAVILGINGEGAKSHRAFASLRALPFPLLTDKGGSVRKRYGVPVFLGLFTNRVTFVIDQEGIIRHVVNSQAGSRKHVAEALETVKKLSYKGSI